MVTAPVLCFLLLFAAELNDPRDRQDIPALQSVAAELGEAVRKNPSDARAQYRLALARSYLSQIALEKGDKALARSAAEDGIAAAERAVALQGGTAEHHRVLGTLCGQVIPANVIAGLRYGKCAMDSINRAIELDPKSSGAYLSRGVGYYYLPPAFGGGVDKAIEDFEQAIRLNPKSADAFLWLGIALRKQKRNAEAREAIHQSLKLNPNRIWAKQQLEKTPAQ